VLVPVLAAPAVSAAPQAQLSHTLDQPAAVWQSCVQANIAQLMEQTLLQSTPAHHVFNSLAHQTRSESSCTNHSSHCKHASLRQGLIDAWKEDIQLCATAET
jgi:hypothetical protein